FLTTALTLTGQTVATFTDPGGAEPVSHYSATIDWGDDSSSAADSISYAADTGQFSVQGSHTYAQLGTYSITVTISHDSAPSATVTTTAQVGRPTSTTTTMAISASIPLAGLDTVDLTASVAASGGTGGTAFVTFDEPQFANAPLDFNLVTPGTGLGPT